MNIISYLFKTVKFHISKLEKESIIAMAGMAVEYHNIFLYGYLVSIITIQFFTLSSPLNILSSILISYVIGPIGAIICGHIGDTLGRKRILAWALAFVSISSFFISILPSYDLIGVSASILFIIFRSIQTLGFGGDAVGLATFILEDAPSKHRGLFGGFMSLGSAVGVMCASLEVSLLDPLNAPINSWKWRFILSLGLLGMLIPMYFYRALNETTTFNYYKKSRFVIKWPLMDLFRNYKLSFLRSVGVFALAPIITIIIFGFIPYLGITHLGLTSKFSMWSNTLALIIFLIFAPCFGALSDKIGRKPILFGVSAIFFILGYPMFAILEQHGSTSFFLIQLFFSLISSAYYGTAMTVNIEHFPTHIRYTGVALSFCISYAFFGGYNGLFFVQSLIKNIHIGTAPVFYLLMGSLIVFTATLFLKEEGHSSLEKD